MVLKIGGREEEQKVRGRMREEERGTKWRSMLERRVNGE